MLYNEDILLDIMVMSEDLSLYLTCKGIFNIFIKNKYVIGKRKLLQSLPDAIEHPEDSFEIYIDILKNGVERYNLNTFKFLVKNNVYVDTSSFYNFVCSDRLDIISYMLENNIWGIPEDVLDNVAIYSNNLQLYKSFYDYGFLPSEISLSVAMISECIPAVNWLIKLGYNISPQNIVTCIAYNVKYSFIKYILKKFGTQGVSCSYYIDYAYRLKRKKIAYLLKKDFSV